MYKYFDIKDFDCQETGNNEMSNAFIRRLDALREVCGFPFYISSGYRDPTHSIEKAKKVPGKHSEGIAADIVVNGGAQRRQIVVHATAMGFGGVGVAKTFVHVDTRDTTPVLWCY